jgi:hypothetical protein
MRIKRLGAIAFAVAIGLIGFLVAMPAARCGSDRESSVERIVLLMVWDGLRPDAVNQRDTPNLYTLAREGVRFDHHHSVFPTITMVDAASLATGGTPGAAGILGDWMYFAPILDPGTAAAIPQIGGLIGAPLDLENSKYLAALDGPGALDGRLLGMAGIATELRHSGGYSGIFGKRGPTFLFDDQAAGGLSGSEQGNYMFVADDIAAPRPAVNLLAGEPPIKHADPGSSGARDAWFARMVIDHGLPAAKAATAGGHPALIVFWQRNPDLAQHLAGLGTALALQALRDCDQNLGRVRRSLATLGIVDRTDLIVVSDHGFATIRAQVSLGDLLVAAGIKQSADSTDIVIARNGGYDLVYLSRDRYAAPQARREALLRIVDFIAAKEWSGPIFSQPGDGDDHSGWIPGTFSQQTIGIGDSPRSPDLIVSFRELPGATNLGLTGPQNPAFVVGADGEKRIPNRSAAIVRPVAGVVFSDLRPESRLTTGMGIHGAAGEREIHNFCTAAGPDFRRHFVDTAPTGNLDVNATIRDLLHRPSAAGAGGRVMREALLKGPTLSGPPPHQFTRSVSILLQGIETVTTLSFSRFDSHDYLDDSSVNRTAHGESH